MDSESEFYGDEDEVLELESRVAAFDPASYWRGRDLIAASVPAMAAIKQETEDTATTTTKLHNPYEGRPACAKQLSETTEAFLARLPPATTDALPERPWIYVANPFIPREDRGGQEAPAEFGAQLGRFVEGGEARLEMMGDMIREAQETAAAISSRGGRRGPTKAAVNREVAVQREGCVNDILMLARMLKVRTGKWMLFVEPAHVNDIWATVVRATVNNELGIAAKVAPREERGSSKERLVCVYTYDFSDREDVSRVLKRLKQLDLVRIGPGRRPIYYKADAYTYLGIASGNPWGIRASIYSSNEFLAPEKETQGRAAARKVKQEEPTGDDGWTF